MVIISLTLTLFYISLIIWYAAGWIRLREFVPVNYDYAELPELTIIIPARNEENNIENCLLSILNQDYPKHKIHVIVVDDASLDNTSALVKKFIEKFSSQIDIQLISIPSSRERTYKKRAILRGLNKAGTDYIITTDADCWMEKNWLNSIGSLILTDQPVFISAPVCFNSESFSQKLQFLEFVGLIAIGGASIFLNSPNMCNGANLAYSKKAFDDVGGYSGNEHIVSGDDEFLLHKMHEKYPDKIRFLKSRNAVVYTNPAGSFTEFIKQRMRWVSKSTHYSNKLITVVLILVYLFNLSILLNFISGIYNPLFFRLAVIQLILKTLAEGLFLSLVLEFFKKSRLLLYILPAQILHIPYVLFIGIAGNIGKINWKDNKK